jgi:hypothetical protein
LQISSEALPRHRKGLAVIPWLEGDASRWAYPALALSVGLFLLGLLAAPIVIARLPTDYFSEARVSRRPSSNWALGWYLARGLRNLVGAGLFVAGVVMLVLPGPGALTMLVGLLLMDFPRKRRLLRGAFEKPQVKSALNWVRRRMKRAPFDD